MASVQPAPALPRPTTEGIEPNALEIVGARAHNLQNLSLTLPRNALVVVTGVSGSGKSSLVFDTIYAEGQRRYLETFSAYVRQFIGGLERPDVDKINGLSPVIAIDQKTTSRNPRSTVGTVTEIYDFLRLLFARIGVAYSWKSGKPMERLSDEAIVQRLQQGFAGKTLALLAPKIRARKGHYREDLARFRKKGYSKARIDGELVDLVPGMQLDRYKTHDIEVAVDRLKIEPKALARLTRSVTTTLEEGKGSMLVLDLDDPKKRVQWLSRHLSDPEHGLSYDEPQPNTFSFNSPYGACRTCNGLGRVLTVAESALLPDPDKPLNKGALIPLEDKRVAKLNEDLKWFLKRRKIKASAKWNELSEAERHEILYGEPDLDFDPEDDLKDNSLYRGKHFVGLANHLQHVYRKAWSEQLRLWAELYLEEQTCPTCAGQRLRKESLHFKVADKNIAELSQMDLIQLRAWFEDLEERLTERQQLIGKELVKEIRQRLDFLLEVGLGYLALDRPAKSLSGGEAQRIRLATQIGSQLMGVLYILDEPSIGLHQRDNHRLIQSLQKLRDIGNSVLVVEHDRDTMLAADYLLDIGPGAGRFGGRIVAQGPPQAYLESGSVTAGYLKDERQIAVPIQRRKPGKAKLKLQGATGHNLKNVTLVLPLGLLVAITGVSGSGKSSLINQTLYPLLHEHAYGHPKNPLPHLGLSGLQNVDKVIAIDQKPIGRTPRSNPATYTGLFTEIRTLFANLPEAQIRGYKPGRFSFNVKGGRCETCGGAGVQEIEMNFLPNVHVPCPTCRGRRYNRETLEVRYRGKSIFDVLDMTIAEAAEFFEALPKPRRILQTLMDVGLGYVTVGQPATTLSGGEAQRMKLATELAKKATGRTIYLLDEPTTGLHFQDIQLLLDVLNRLVERGNTVVVIEHNLDVIKVADWVVDLGPEGGSGGGEIIATGTPEQVAAVEASHTGRFLGEELRRTQS